MDKRFVIEGVDAATPVAEAAPAILLAKSAPLFALEGEARGGDDMDAVHDMRVASRRLREAMRLLAPVYPRTRSKTWYKRVRRITRALGPVRDSDVFIDAFAKLGQDVGEGGGRVVAFMVGYRSGQRAAELARLQRTLAQVDLSGRQDEFARIARAARTRGDGGVPLADFAYSEIAERAGVVLRAQPGARAESHVPQQHALRIDYKRLRYAVEVFAPCYGERFDALHDTLTAFQDGLGELHDTYVFLGMLKDPDRVAEAARGGITEGDIAEVAGVLERRAKDQYRHFIELCRAHPASKLLPALLLPLASSGDRATAAGAACGDGEPPAGAPRPLEQPHSAAPEPGA